MTPSQLYMAGSGMQAAGGLASTLLQNHFNKKEAQRARDWSEGMWNKQNEYNLPVNQMLRLKEAGINPNLAFGSAASAMSGSVPSVPDSPRSADYAKSLSGAIDGYFSRKFEEKRLTSTIHWQDQQTRKLRLDNDTTEMLLDDYRKMKRSEYALNHLRNTVDQTLYGRQRNLEVDLLSSRWMNDLDKFFAHVPHALAGHYRAQDELLRYKTLNEFESYLTNREKGKFERKYYRNFLNPYETSTVAGALRSILGTIFNIDEEMYKPKSKNNATKIKEGLKEASNDLDRWPTFGAFARDLMREFVRSFSWYKPKTKSYTW